VGDDPPPHCLVRQAAEGRADVLAHVVDADREPGDRVQAATGAVDADQPAVAVEQGIGQ